MLVNAIHFVYIIALNSAPIYKSVCVVCHKVCLCVRIFGCIVHHEVVLQIVQPRPKLVMSLRYRDTHRIQPTDKHISSSLAFISIAQDGQVETPAMK